MAKYLVIVESPAKCKTIEKFLGKDYVLTASYGHVRDLPNKKLGVDIKDNFKPAYTNLKEKSKTIKEISTLAKKSDIIYLATDPDREGEAIAWHIINAAKLPKTKIKRIVFNEITEKALKGALLNSRQVNEQLVNAQQARRVLDRLIGYKLSPVLSTKIQRGLSAGRVQSVAVKIVCDREREILAFVPQEYWTIEASLNKDADVIKANLFAKDTPQNKLTIENETQATDIENDLLASDFSVDDIATKRIQRKPAPPFITSTLQQEASRKLNWSSKKTMLIAQKLYEGVMIDGEQISLITYMRTDSTRLSDDAIKMGSNFIEKNYSDKYLAKRQNPKTKKQNVQDAHEAVRPAYIDYPPKKIEAQLENDYYKLYKLIWDRYLASLMNPAEIDRTTVTIKASKNNYLLKTIGNVVVFDGFTVIYSEGKDDETDDHDNVKKLPPFKKGDSLTKKEILKEQKFTTPPPRFTEASLVKELEEQGIGRPSTYAPTMSVVQDRGYIKKEGKKLQPTDLGMVVNEQLEAYFDNIIDIKFTASMENQLDDIQDGKHDWQDIVKSYYMPLDDKIKNAYDKMEKVDFGQRVLGIDPESGNEVIAKIGRFGPMIQIGRGNNEKDEKPKFAGLLKGQEIETITLEEALELFTFPKHIGAYEGEDVTVNLGKYGPYVKVAKTFVSIPAELSISSVTIDDAIKLIEEKKEKDANKTIHDFSENDPPIYVLNGPYGAYIKIGKRNFRIPKDVEPKSLTIEKCIEISKNQPKRKKK